MNPGPTADRRLDAQAQALVEEHMPLAQSLAYRHYRSLRGSVPLEELRGEALFGLVYAASLYDSKKGIPFGAYATMVIRHRLIHAGRMWQHRGWNQTCFSDLATSIQDLEMSMDPECPHTRPPDREVENRDLLQRLFELLDDEASAELLYLRTVEGHSCADLARRRSLSRERIRQILAKVVARLRLRLRQLT